MKTFLVSFIIALSCNFSYSQEITIECNFLYTRITDSSTSAYLCMLSKQQISATATSIKFTGNHQSGKTDASVLGFLITDCNVPSFNYVLMDAMHSQFPNIKYIEVFASNVQEIVPGAFNRSANSEKILKVHFLFNNIKTLADGAFSGLTSVENFRFVSNRLQTVSEDAFKGMKSVTRLDLQYNHIKVLPKNVFKSMFLLGSIDISNNLIEVIDGEIFDGNEMLQYIYISYNQIKAIGRRFFAGLYQFNDISAYNNLCVSNTFRYREAAMRGFEKCFDNYDILFP
ncbi:hypothetical protein PVAND_001865 [Polypedilum vanderplanki]|uniref:Uncharacterized protein n=1 Tax=Polypedilum vanderplanki TaxID=319348 RepID=A0A9J6BPQ2_POLVA|nr:hypothetical protein PVAND_001865 [Polypedilum vanderplanki]